jgi:soluble cytochrome b562
MRKRNLIAACCLTLATLAGSGTAGAHGGEMHAMMPMFSQALAELEQALEKRDAAAAERESSRMLAAIPDLKKSHPHKNVRQLKSYRAQAVGLEQSLTSVRELAQKGDFVAATTAFQKVEAQCAACHARFRD